MPCLYIEIAGRLKLLSIGLPIANGPGVYIALIKGLFRCCRDKACLVSTTKTTTKTQYLMDKYKNKYRISSSRAPWWHYGNAGAYFITICTKGRKHFFGEIENQIMTLSPAGIVADILWHEIKNHFQNVELDAFQVMPNHLHGILILTVSESTKENTDTREHYENVLNAAKRESSKTDHGSSTEDFNNITSRQKRVHPRFQNQGKNTVSSIIGSYKSAVTKHLNRLKIDFEWQASFYDNIIMNDQQFVSISNYIARNVSSWEKDKFFGRNDKKNDFGNPM
jgi:REP element-mobilizing transposase RayT